MGFQNKTAGHHRRRLGIGRCLTRAFAQAGAKVAFLTATKGPDRKTWNFSGKPERTSLFFRGMGKIPRI